MADILAFKSLEEIAKGRGHVIDIEEMVERADGSAFGELTVFRPVCSCGWTLSREQFGGIQVGWRYGRHNAEKIGMEHIVSVAHEKGSK